jgi:hypothetical protein
MKSMIILAGVLVALSSTAFAEECPVSRTSNDNVAGMGGSTHGRVLTQEQQAQAAAPCASPGDQSETTNANAFGLGASTHGRRWR